MSQNTKIQTKWAVASYLLKDAYADFILSRQAILCSPNTIRFCHFTATIIIDRSSGYIYGYPQQAVLQLSVQGRLPDDAARDTI